MTFTIFSIPKAYEGLYATIQHNALKSWRVLSTNIEIILFGNEKGINQLAKIFRCRYEPHIERNKFKTPLVRNIFRRAELLSNDEYLLFLNADIIIDPSIVKVFNRVRAEIGDCLVISRRWNTTIDKPINFANKNWFGLIKTKVEKSGKLYSKMGIDLFIFPKKLFRDIPNFAIGRAVMDNWMLYYAKSKNIPIVDITEAITLVHQNHPPRINKAEGTTTHTGKEFKSNLRLAGGYAYCYTVDDTDYSVDNKLNITKVNQFPYNLLVRIKREIHKKVDRYLFY